MHISTTKPVHLGIPFGRGVKQTCSSELDQEHTLCTGIFLHFFKIPSKYFFLGEGLYCSVIALPFYAIRQQCLE